MSLRQLNAGVVRAVLLGLVVLAPGPALAGNMWNQQVIPLVHIPQAGGPTLTANYMITATEAAVTVNIKCFNEASQRIGPAQGVNVGLSARGQVSFQTPTTLLVTTDPLFAGLGWCWMNNISSDEAYSIEVVIGMTSSLVPNGVLTSPTSTLVAANTGLARTSSGQGGLPYYTTPSGVSPGAAQNFLVIVNPLTSTRVFLIQLYDTSGFPVGNALARTINARGILLLPVPGAFPSQPPSGSITIVADGNGYLGWFAQFAPNRLLFTVIGLDEGNLTLLPRASAP